MLYNLLSDLRSHSGYILFTSAIIFDDKLYFSKIVMHGALCGAQYSDEYYSISMRQVTFIKYTFEHLFRSLEDWDYWRPAHDRGIYPE